MNKYLRVILILLLMPCRGKAQNKSVDPVEYVCVDPTLMQSPNGDVVSLPCRIASIKGDTLSATDRAVIDMMRGEDFEFSFRMQTKGTDSVTFQSLRSAYDRNAHALCQSHPKMVFA